VLELITRTRARPEQGLTLIELLVVLVVLAILATIAAPSFREILAKDRATTTANDLLASIAQTRSEAIRLNRTAELCPRDPANANACGNSWSNGWVIRIDQDGNGASDTTVQVRDNLPDGVTMTSTLTGNPPKLTFKELGQASAAASFTVTHTDPAVTRLVCIYAGGQNTLKQTGAC
jgi:type IV fimbrial biogenesis protein FimT